MEDERAGKEGTGATTTLRVPPVAEGEHSPRLRHTPSALAVNDRRRADFWRNVAILGLIGSQVLCWLTVGASRSTEQIFVMDPAGGVYAGPLESLSESKRFFHTTVLFVANSALQWSPVGFDLPELNRLYFRPRALAKLEEIQKTHQEDIRKRNLQFKPIIETIGDPVPAGERRIIEVRGRLGIGGAYAGKSFYEEKTYLLVLTFGRNPDVGKAGAYPWAVEEIDLKIQEGRR